MEHLFTPIIIQFSSILKDMEKYQAPTCTLSFFQIDNDTIQTCDSLQW